MKAKKLVLAVAALTAFSSLAACTNSNKKILFNDYWEKNAMAHGTIDETLSYKVTHEKGAGIDAIGYKLTYGEGTYVTTLKSQGDGYVYTTSLTMPVTYQYGTTEAKTVIDSVTSKVVFARSNSGLRPTSSQKRVVSHTPSSAAGVSSDTCYSFYDFSIETSYPAEGEATTTVTYNKVKGEPVVQDFAFAFTDDDYSCLDNEQVLLALRAISSSTTMGSFMTYSPFVKKMQKIDFTFQTEASAEFSYKLNGQSAKATIAYRPVNISIDDSNPGATQTAWIASTTNAQNNTHRNVMLKLITPLSYSLGNLVYELVSITRV